MRVLHLLITVLITLSAYGSNSLLVLDMQGSKEKKEKQVNKINKEISSKDFDKQNKKSLPHVKSIKVGNQWILVSAVKDRNETNKISIILHKKYPSALIIDNKDAERVLVKQDIKDGDYESFLLEWSILIAIALIGIAGVIFVLIRASKIKKMQDELEYQQKDLMHKILKSEKYV